MFLTMHTKSDTAREQSEAVWTYPLVDRDGHADDYYEIARVEMSTTIDNQFAVTIMPKWLRDFVVLDDKGNVLFKMHGGRVVHDPTALLTDELVREGTD